MIEISFFNWYWVIGENRPETLDLEPSTVEAWYHKINFITKSWSVFSVPEITRKGIKCYPETVSDSVGIIHVKWLVLTKYSFPTALPSTVILSIPPFPEG